MLKQNNSVNNIHLLLQALVILGKRPPPPPTIGSSKKVCLQSNEKLIKTTVDLATIIQYQAPTPLFIPSPPHNFKPAPPKMKENPSSFPHKAIKYIGKYQEVPSHKVDPSASKTPSVHSIQNVSLIQASQEVCNNMLNVKKRLSVGNYIESDLFSSLYIPILPNKLINNVKL